MTKDKLTMSLLLSILVISIALAVWSAYSADTGFNMGFKADWEQRQTELEAGEIRPSP